MTDYATLLRDHVTLRVRSIDRIFLQAYVPYVERSKCNGVNTETCGFSLRTALRSGIRRAKNASIHPVVTGNRPAVRPHALAADTVHLDVDRGEAGAQAGGATL